MRQVKEGIIAQGTTEAWQYQLDTAPVAGTATGTPTLTIYEDTANSTDVTAALTTTPNCTLAGTVITTPVISGVGNGKQYRCVIRWSVGGGQFRSRYFILRGEL
jgi:hypothetical protein